MNRISLISPTSAEGETKEILDKIKEDAGRVPNIFKAMAHSPAVLKGYLGFKAGFNSSFLDSVLREKIALAVAEENKCEYCLAAHSAIAGMEGASEAEVLASRQVKSDDAKTQAILEFAVLLVKTRARVSDEQLEKVRAAGISDAEITEIVANVCFNIFTNYFNHVAEPMVDFPKAEPLEESK